MIDKKTVFVLGAGASCPYGYPSSTRLREWICSPEEFLDYPHLQRDCSAQNISVGQVKQFKDTFAKSSIKSIDIFIANNPKLAPVGKYIIAFEIFRAEQSSFFREEAKLRQEEHAYMLNNHPITPRHLQLKPLFQGGDWYFYLYNQLIKGSVGKDALPDFSDGKIVFITFNYDRSLEQFLYESLRNSFTEVPEDKIIESLKQLKILHVYGQIVPLKWQNSELGVDYRPGINEQLLQKAVASIRTIYEQRESPELDEARRLLKEAEQAFFLGFSYAPENMEILNLPSVLSATAVSTCYVYGTAFGAENKEIGDIQGRFVKGLKPGSEGWKNTAQIEIVNIDCLKLLRNYF